MKLQDLIAPSDLKRALEEKMVKIQYSEDGQKVYNYSDLALFTPGAWDNPAVRLSRGLIVGTDGEIVARPYEKFWNVGQAEAGDVSQYFDSLCEVTDKADGSMLAFSLDERGQLRCTTRGSFQSFQAVDATEWLHENWHPTDLNTFKTHTLIGEWIHPMNRIVLDYGDKSGIVILGACEIETGKILGPVEAAELFHCPLETTEVVASGITFKDALGLPDRLNREGYVIRIPDANVLLKSKQADYVAFHKLIFGLSERVVWEHMIAGESLSTLLAPLPDELHEWTREVWKDLWSEANKIAEECSRDYDYMFNHLPDEWTRKDFAEIAQKSEFRPLLFLLLDGRDIREPILKSLRPSGANKARLFSEDVA